MACNLISTGRVGEQPTVSQNPCDPVIAGGGQMCSNSQCCPKGTGCCTLVENADAACCPNGEDGAPAQTCVNAGDRRNVCSAVNGCGAGKFPCSGYIIVGRGIPPSPQTIPITVCCAPPDDGCGYFEVGPWLPPGYKGQYPICTRSVCPPEQQCPPNAPAGQSVCCDAGQLCVDTSYGSHGCGDESCPSENGIEMELCPGKAGGAELNLCCPAGTCANYPDGRAYCLPQPRPSRP